MTGSGTAPAADVTKAETAAPASNRQRAVKPAAFRGAFLQPFGRFKNIAAKPLIQNNEIESKQNISQYQYCTDKNGGLSFFGSHYIRPIEGPDVVHDAAQLWESAGLLMALATGPMWRDVTGVNGC